MKMLVTYLTLITAFLFSGCDKVIYVPKPYAVPVKCEVPYTPCVLHGKPTDIVIQLRECIVTIREDAKVCQKNVDANQSTTK